MSIQRLSSSVGPQVSGAPDMAVENLDSKLSDENSYQGASPQYEYTNWQDPAKWHNGFEVMTNRSR